MALGLADHVASYLPQALDSPGYVPIPTTTNGRIQRSRIAPDEFVAREYLDSGTPSKRVQSNPGASVLTAQRGAGCRRWHTSTTRN
jgi:hypothetical protein